MAVNMFFLLSQLKMMDECKSPVIYRFFKSRLAFKEFWKIQAESTEPETLEIVGFVMTGVDTGKK